MQCDARPCERHHIIALHTPERILRSLVAPGAPAVVRDVNVAGGARPLLEAGLVRDGDHSIAITGIDGHRRLNRVAGQGVGDPVDVMRGL